MIVMCWDILTCWWRQIKSDDNQGIKLINPIGNMNGQISWQYFQQLLRYFTLEQSVGPTGLCIISDCETGAIVSSYSPVCRYNTVNEDNPVCLALYLND